MGIGKILPVPILPFEDGAGEDTSTDGFETGDMTGWDSTSP